MTAPSGQDGPLRRLRLLEDEEALRGLLVRGSRALDRKDWQTCIGCWAEDAVLEFGPWGEARGRGRSWRRSRRRRSPSRRRRHARGGGLGPVRDGRTVRLGVPQGRGRRPAPGPPAARSPVDHGRGHRAGCLPVGPACRTAV
ncbi:nuclear transport factor 2 family protein [Streptomyces sp. TN58]|uniref:nuclear transport factor 2 family protein n=1 Tax=Streptomyces sp. TN58 TaxID=234612 RepID=UPI00095046F1|nr:nuclear transport factor 2 family protein [Streptomyces sp. TN58]APU42661.1 hypothetical protein BSL84_25650 [Streptomyces sp. TN58]